MSLACTTVPANSLISFLFQCQKKNMREHGRSDTLRFRTAAPTCIFDRSLTYFGHRRCRNGRRLRSCLARSSCWPSCKPVPWRSLRTFYQISTSLLCVWNSFHRPRGVHSYIRREQMFIGFRGLAKPLSRTNLASARPYLISLRTLHWETGGVSRNNLPRLSSCCLSRDTSTQPPCVSHQPRSYVHGRCHFPPRDVFPTRAESIEYDLPLRIVLVQLHRYFDF